MNASLNSCSTMSAAGACPQHTLFLARRGTHTSGPCERRAQRSFGVPTVTCAPLALLTSRWDTLLDSLEPLDKMREGQTWQRPKEHLSMPAALTIIQSASSAFHGSTLLCTGREKGTSLGAAVRECKQRTSLAGTGVPGDRRARLWSRAGRS